MSVTEVPQLDIQKFENGEIPRLFSSTRDFRFKSRDGSLIHRTLPQGPKGFHVVSVNSSGHTASFVEHHRTALTIPICGAANVTVDNETIRVEAGNMLVLGPSDRHSELLPCQSGKNYQSFTIIFPAKTSYHKKHMLQRDPAKVAHIKELIEFTFKFLMDDSRSTIRSIALMESLIEDTLLLSLQDTADSRDSGQGNTHLERVVDRSQDFFLTHLREPVSISDVVRAVGVGRATLHKAFQERRATTPRKFLADLRLTALRQSLENPRDFMSVTSAAMDVGFFHLGRCSAAYRLKYGELPSKTLRRSRERMI